MSRFAPASRQSHLSSPPKILAPVELGDVKLTHNKPRKSNERTQLHIFYAVQLCPIFRTICCPSVLHFMLPVYVPCTFLSWFLGFFAMRCRLCLIHLASIRDLATGMNQLMTLTIHPGLLCARQCTSLRTTRVTKWNRWLEQENSVRMKPKKRLSEHQLMIT